MGRRVAVYFVVFSLWVLSAAGPARADEAKQLYEQGVIHFKEGDYAAAQEAFKEAYNLSGRADLLYNLGVCAERLGDVQRAIAYYQVYLDERPDAPDAEQVRAKMEKLQEPLDAPALAVEIVPAEDKGPPEEPEPPPESPPEPPDEPGEAPSEQAPVTEPEQAEAGGSAPLAAEPPDALAEERDEEVSLYIPGALLGGGGLLLAGGAVAGIAALKERDSLEKSCAPGCSQSAIDKGKGIAVTADVLLGLGAAAVVAGGVWILLDRWKRKKRTGEMTLTAAPLGGGAAVLVQGSFP